MISVLLYTGCTSEEEDIFSESSAKRIEATLQADKELLCAPKNGWIMEYYPAATQQYGGYNIWVSFAADGKVTVANEVYGADETATSLYSLKQSAGPVLTFDTYNELMHFFSDPANPAGVGTPGKGMEGDFEFTILSAETTKFVLKGKKTGSYIVMTALPDNVTGEAFLADIVDAAGVMNFVSYLYEVNGKSIPVSGSYRNLTFTYEKDGEQVSVDAPYIVTATGYKFYEPLTIEGVTVDELTYQKVGEEESFIPINGVAAKLKVVIPPINQQFLSGKWYFAYSGLGALTKAYWDYTKANGLDAIEEELYYAYLGTYTNGQYGFCFGSAAGSSVYTGLLVYQAALIGENQVKLTFASSGAGDGVWYYSNAAFSYLINPVGTSTGKTFTLTTDDIKNPSWIKLTDNSNANNSMVLYNSPVYWPYDK